jgi:hypothetical protein
MGVCDKNKNGRQKRVSRVSQEGRIKILPDQGFMLTKLGRIFYEASLWQEFVWE